MFDFVASAAPGRQGDRHGRQAVLGGQGAATTTLVVVDASASGHIVGQLAAPQAINQLVQVGLVRQQTGWMLDILDDPATTGLVVVATPAEMPVSETLELTARLRARDQRRPGRRRRQPGPARAVRSRRGGGVRTPGEPRTRRPGSTPPLGGSTGPLMEAARLTVTMRRSRTEHLETLRAAIDPGGPAALRPLPVLPQSRAASHPPARRRPLGGAGLLMAATAERRPGQPGDRQRPSRPCSPPRRSSSRAARAASARRPPRRPRPPWPPAGSAARSSS